MLMTPSAPSGTAALLHPLQGVRGARLLALLDALVVRDGSAPALAGRVSVGVRCDDGRWAFWRATPDVRRTTTELFNAAPSADVTLVLDADVAESILKDGRTPENSTFMAIDGDRALFKKFAQRYLEPRSWLDVRTGAMIGTKGSGSRE